MPCIFCASSPTTNEHALPRWLAKPLGAGGRTITHRYSLPPDGSEPLRQWSKKGLDLKVGVVCAQCNHGWMNDLEGRVRPALGALIRGESRNLSPEDCEAITAWLVKTVLMLQQAEPPDRRLVREGLYDELYAKQRPPARVQAWLARNNFEAGVASGTRGFSIQRGSRKPTQTWGHALVMRHLAMVLFDLGIGPAREITVVGPLANAVAPIWPEPLGGPFPPPVQLGTQQTPLILHLLAASAR